MKSAVDDWFQDFTAFLPYSIVFSSFSQPCLRPEQGGMRDSATTAQIAAVLAGDAPQDFSLVAEAAATTAADAAASVKESRHLFCYDLDQYNPEAYNTAALDLEFLQSLSKLLNAKSKVTE
eukprot:4317285-Amphidinium_carterae.1